MCAFRRKHVSLVSHWEIRSRKGKCVAWFTLSSNYFPKQIILANFDRQPRCHVVFPYLIVTVTGTSCRYHVLCLLLLLLCFSILPLLFISILCVCSSFRIKIERKHPGPQKLWPSQAKAKSEVPVNHSC